MVTKDQIISEITNYAVSKINTLSDKPITAIKKIKKQEVITKIKKKCFLITLNKKAEGYSSIMLPNLDIFDEDFQSLVTKIEEEKIKHKSDNKYWFTFNWYSLGFSDDNDNEASYNDIDDVDYMRDTWDAMTDGVYGDMPDGFNGNFDFLGR